MNRSITKLLYFTSFLGCSFSSIAQVSTCTAPLPGSANCYQTSRPNGGNPLTNWTPLPHQDCCNAIGVTNPLSVISNDVIIPTGAPLGTLFPGCVQDELPNPANTCFNNNEKGTVWYKFQVAPLPGGPTANGSPAGKLRFKIVPQDALDDPAYDPATDQGTLAYGHADFDFLLFDVTNTYYSPGGACASIRGSSSYGVPGSVISRCNWAALAGPTGLFEPGTGIDDEATRFNKPLNVFVGQIFYLAVDNFSVNVQGYQLDFRGEEAPDDSTAQLYAPEGNPEIANIVTGSVFRNMNSDCIQNANEPAARYRLIKAEPGPYYSFTGTDGKYTLYTDSGNISITQMPTQFLGLIEAQVCPPNNGGYTTHFSNVVGDTSKGNNFANYIKECHFLTLGVSSGRRRRCAESSTVLRICNIGIAASPAATAIRVRYPAHIQPQSASIPFVFDPTDSTFVFQVGSVASNGCITIQTVDMVICAPGITGTTECVRAWVTPSNNCQVPTADWDGTDLHVSNICQAALPTFKIKNTGATMTQMRPYKVFVNGQFSYTGFVSLSGGDSTFIQVNTTQGGIVRVEISQSTHHPYTTFSAAQSGCNTGGPAPVVFATPDEDPTEVISCGLIMDSFDPNEKLVSPAGVGAQGLVAPNRPFEYQLHFQNTGNDYAYRVVLIDTLDENLDPATLEEVASSHAYQLTVSGRVRPILKFTFQNIMLPDSATNPLGSNGFVTFRIRPYSTLPLGTQIRNRALIYFDFNDPIATNTTVNTLYEPVLVPGLVNEVIVLGKNSLINKGNGISAYPNPNTGLFLVRTSEPSTLRILTVTGKELQRQTVSVGEQPLDLRAYGKGIYLLESKSANGISTVKLVVQ